MTIGTTVEACRVNIRLRTQNVPKDKPEMEVESKKLGDQDKNT